MASSQLADLHDALNLQSPPSVWTYYPSGPYLRAEQLAEWLATIDGSVEVIITPDGKARGVACYLQIDPANGVVEIGNIVLSNSLQRTTAATEAIFLMLSHAFDELCYRRVEWKCDSLNAPSRVAATRFGFSFEGIFRNHRVYRGRNRDTAWYAITDTQWPSIRAEFERWLAATNFDQAGNQSTPLAARALSAHSPGLPS